MNENHSRRLRRAGPVIALAGVAFTVGAIAGADRGSPAPALAASFIAHWTRGEYGAMYSAIDASSRRMTSAGDFAAAYREALTTATATRLNPNGRPHDAPGGRLAVPIRVRTRLFGTISADVTLDVRSEHGEGPRIAWSRSLTFPGLHSGELLHRRTVLPRRATLLARDGSVLAEGASPTQPGAARSSPLGELASAVLGTVGPMPPARRQALEAEGVPHDALVGVSGIERALDDRLRGTPGGELLAGERVLASAAPRAAPTVRSSVSPGLQRAVVSALGGQYGGIVALAPATGQILAVAGIGLEGLQPPGSTFKIVTVAGVLAAHIAKPRSVFPYATYATLDGVRLHNANGEECGGSLELAFAVSCNSVFAPLGVKLGATRLVAMAERFGFNQPPPVPGAAESTLPAAGGIRGELDLGSTAIGQGQVQASALQVAIVAATIAEGGRRPEPTFTPVPLPVARASVTSASVAHTVRRLMIGVVRSGTGTAAAIPGVVVAGKTGTAELESACPRAGAEPGGGESGASEAPPGGCQPAASEASNTDAWFAAFAPALHPRIAVGVLLVKAGAGGSTAAPVARQVLEAGLRASR